MKREILWLQEGWKLCFALAALIASIGFTVQSIQKAYAFSGTVLDYTQLPYESFTGTISNGQSNTLLTVPTGQKFIVTGGTEESIYCDLYAGSTKKVEGYSRALSSSGGLLSQGKGHIIIEEGLDLIMIGSGSTCVYYIEGFYVPS